MNSIKIMTRKEQEHLRAALRARGGTDVEDVPPGAIFVLRDGESVVTAYKSGKVLFQGKNAAEVAGLAEKILEHAVEKKEPIMRFPIVGGDESGKGDLFGPLVIAAFVTHDDVERHRAVEAGARDCKLMSDKDVQIVAERLRGIGTSAVRVLMPMDYNARYARVRNVNILLNESYRELLHDVAVSSGAQTVILDKYGGRALELWQGTQQFQFVVESHAERYPEVAAASVLARAAFLDGLDETAREHGLSHLPKGASIEVQVLMRQLALQKGKDWLRGVAKVNFAPVREYLDGLF
ncbi:MAG: ribonuclease HIII [Candidatus Cryosericum sp.]|nr:ribonuclease HIII [bacterium]